MKHISPVFLSLLSFFSISCAHHHHRHIKKESLAPVSPVNNSKVHGYVRFKQWNEDQVLVIAKVAGLKPGGKYGFHIHRYGECRENGVYAGPHFNPYGSEHGAPHSEERHEGDLGNLTAGPNGVALYKKIIDICLYKISGRSVIIHARPDDLRSQPSGNAGPYIGCGVIGRVHPLTPNTGILKVGDFKFQVSRAYIKSRLQSAAIKDDVKVAPYRQKGKIIGFRFTYIKENSVYARFGFKVSDIILSINGEKPRSKLHFTELLKRSKTRARLDMIIQRAGKTIAFSWSVIEELTLKKIKAPEAKDKNTPPKTPAVQKTKTPEKAKEKAKKNTQDNSKKPKEKKKAGPAGSEEKNKK